MKLFIIIIFLFLGCKTQEATKLNNKLSKQILLKQKGNRNFETSSFYARKLLIAKNKNLKINKSDTLFLIERISEPDLQFWCHLWSSKRDSIIEYSNEFDGFKDSTYDYSIWNEHMKKYVEKFDTTSIDKHQIFGGYRSFITQVIGGKNIKTFFFYDPKSSFNTSKVFKQNKH